MPRLTALATLLLLTACGAERADTGGGLSGDDVLIVDTHIDVPYRLHKRAANVGEATDHGDFDYPRARAGGLDAAFMSIYIPAAVDEAGEGLALADTLIESVEALATDHPEKFVVATCPSDVLEARKRGLIALPMGMENGGPIGGDLDVLEGLFDKGIRYVTLAHSKSNSLSDSSYDDNKAWGGLSEDGRAVVRRMNRLGMMVDVSHLSDDAFWHVLRETTSPVIASHSSLRHFTPGWERNMSDEMVEEVGARGGVVQINFGSGFLTQTARAWGEKAQADTVAFMQSQHLALDSPQLATFRDRYREDHPYPYATMDDVLDHIDRAVRLATINGVGIGSDYDGVGDSLPTGLKDVRDYPNLIQGLRERGYSSRAIRNIMGDNVLRVWRANYLAGIRHGTRPQCRL